MQKIKTLYKAFTKNYSITEIPILLAQLTHFFQCYIHFLLFHWVVLWLNLNKKHLQYNYLSKFKISYRWVRSLINSQTVRTAARSAAFTAIPICCKLSPHVLFHPTAVHGKLVLAILIEGAANDFLPPADTCHT